ncbi:MAG: FAD-binding protein [Limnohabitans sp.]|nr:FAD-binding protein [Limnohabitans sp.]
MHNVLPNSHAFPYHLGRYCRKLGVDIRLNTRAKSLVKEGGRITGLEAEIGVEKIRFKARRGVVLVAGDYSASEEYKSEFVSEEVALVDAVNVTATGDGFRIALEQGATMVNAGRIRGPVMRFVPPPHTKFIQRIPPLRTFTRLMRWSFENLPDFFLRPFMMSFLTTALGPSFELTQQGAILINRDGYRFTDELKNQNMSVSRQPERLAWFIFDEDTASRFTRWPYFVSTAPGVAYAYLPDYRRTRPDLFVCVKTLDELAGRLGLPSDALKASIEAYNDNRSFKGIPGRGSRPAICKLPFYALGPAKSYIVFTNGSLRVSQQLEVLDGTGHPILGLYAAGSNGQGAMLLEGHGHHLGWAFTSGRIAGRQAAFCQ